MLSSDDLVSYFYKRGKHPVLDWRTRYLLDYSSIAHHVSYEQPERLPIETLIGLFDIYASMGIPSFDDNFQHNIEREFNYHNRIWVSTAEQFSFEREDGTYEGIRIHLPNDGYIYSEESKPETKKLILHILRKLRELDNRWVYKRNTSFYSLDRIILDFMNESKIYQFSFENGHYINLVGEEFDEIVHEELYKIPSSDSE